MTLAYWCVLIAAYLPVALTGLAKFSGGKFGKSENEAPRDYLNSLSGWRQRANWAQMNGFEAFPPFAAAVIIAHLCVVDQSTLNMLAVGFVILRVLHAILYIANLGYLRSIVWFASVGCVVALFALSACLF
ncbi:MAG: MAPEG family protein [Gammaproteobacteria bacterium]|nr:MAPEG family protein [Gammaproteobacteria bacterium]